MAVVTAFEQLRRRLKLWCLQCLARVTRTWILHMRRYHYIGLLRQGNETINATRSSDNRRGSDNKASDALGNNPQVETFFAVSAGVSSSTNIMAYADKGSKPKGEIRSEMIAAAKVMTEQKAAEKEASGKESDLKTCEISQRDRENAQNSANCKVVDKETIIKEASTKEDGNKESAAQKKDEPADMLKSESKENAKKTDRSEKENKELNFNETAAKGASHKEVTDKSAAGKALSQVLWRWWLHDIAQHIVFWRLSVATKLDLDGAEGAPGRMDSPGNLKLMFEEVETQQRRQQQDAIGEFYLEVMV